MADPKEQVKRASDRSSVAKEDAGGEPGLESPARKRAALWFVPKEPMWKLWTVTSLTRLQIFAALGKPDTAATTGKRCRTTPRGMFCSCLCELGEKGVSAEPKVGFLRQILNGGNVCRTLPLMSSTLGAATKMY